MTRRTLVRKSRFMHDTWTVLTFRRRCATYGDVTVAHFHSWADAMAHATSSAAQH